jgi:hypothetical protein
MADTAYSKFNNTDVKCVLWWSHYFSELAAPSIPGSIDKEFLSLRSFEGEHVEEQPLTSEKLKQYSELCTSNVTAQILYLFLPEVRITANAYIVERGGHLDARYNIVFSDFNVIYFSKSSTYVRNVLRDFSISSCNNVWRCAYTP